MADAVLSQVGYRVRVCMYGCVHGCTARCRYMCVRVGAGRMCVR